MGNSIRDNMKDAIAEWFEQSDLIDHGIPYENVSPVREQAASLADAIFSKFNIQPDDQDLIGCIDIRECALCGCLKACKLGLPERTGRKIQIRKGGD